MTLVEISEREVIEKAKAWYRSVLPESPYEERLYAAIDLLIERERVEQSLDTGTVPQPLVNYPDPGNASLVDVSIYPPMAEGQCHWENGFGKIVGPTRDCPHIAENRVSGETQNPAMSPLGYIPEGAVSVSPDIPESYQQPAPRPGAEPIPRRPKKLSRKAQMAEARRASDITGRDREDIDYSSDDLPSVR